MPFYATGFPYLFLVPVLPGEPVCDLFKMRHALRPLRAVTSVHVTDSLKRKENMIFIRQKIKDFHKCSQRKNGDIF